MQLLINSLWCILHPHKMQSCDAAAHVVGKGLLQLKLNVAVQLHNPVNGQVAMFLSLDEL